MNRQVIIWFLLTGVAAAMAWYLQKFLSDLIKPRESVLRFIIFLLLTFVCIFLIIVIYGYLVIKGGLI
jgi:predicted PurR-regulated permease PerM